MVDQSRTNRRDQIVDVASELFIQHGYSATSIRQIAERVGCTEAAIYYHFKDGKRELFQAVVECHIPDLMSILDECDTATSLQALVVCFGQGMLRAAYDRVERMRWIVAEFPKLNDEEKALLHANHLQFNDRLTQLVHKFVQDEREARHIAWMMACAGMGYGQLFRNLGLEHIADFTPQDMIKTMSDMLAKK